MKTEVFTKQEIWAATRPNVYKNKKKYTRKKIKINQIKTTN